MLELIVFGIILTYIAYWVVKALIDKLYFEALLGMGVGVLSTQIFIIANYAGQFLRFAMDRKLNASLQFAGLILLVASIAFLGSAFASKRKLSNLVSLWGSTQVFMTQGIYGIIRHPIQLGGILASIGISLLMANIVVMVLGVIASATFFAASTEEDRHSQEKIGSEYSLYMQNVPAFNFILGIFRALQNNQAS